MILVALSADRVEAGTALALANLERGTDNANPIENVVNVPRHATHVTCR